MQGVLERAVDRTNEALSIREAVREWPLGHAGAARATRLFSLEQRTHLKGEHARRLAPVAGMAYAAGIALTGTPSHVSATVTIAEIDARHASPALRIVEHTEASFAGVAFAEQQIAWLLERWERRAAVVGIAPGLGPMRIQARDANVDVYPLTPHRRGDLADAMLRAVNAGRVQIYTTNATPQSRQFWAEIVKAQARVTKGSLDFFVTSGGDAYVTSLALAIEAGQGLLVPAQGRLDQLLCA
ncbi:MAG: hypothetical protein HY261_00675 [Chloroflexi bacterium]|nr:hypothetical protein [Chloroflexota bacterium]